MNNTKTYLIQQAIIKIYKQAKDLNTKLNLQCLQARFDTCKNTKVLGLDIEHKKYKDLGFTICDYIGTTLDIIDYLVDLFDNYDYQNTEDFENNETDILGNLTSILYKITDNPRDFISKYKNKGVEDFTLATLTELTKFLDKIENNTKEA